MERTIIDTCTTLDAFGCINDKWFPDLTCDRTDRTISRTFGTTLTCFRIDLIANQCFTVSGSASFVNHMLDVLLTEILQRTEYRQGCALTKSTKGRVGDRLSQFL